MSKYENRQELANKIDNEGGMYDMLFGYGLDGDELPEDDAELLAAWDRLAALAVPFDVAVTAFENLLPEPGDEDE